MRTMIPDMESPSIPGCGIAVMAKASAPGRTKTRLVPPLTCGRGGAFNTAFLQDVAANILAASAQASIAGYMAFGPPASKPFFQAPCRASIGLIEAWYPNFGDCLFSAIVQLIERGHARCGRAQFRQSDLADLASGRDRQTCWRDRAIAPCSAPRRRRLLPARRQAAHAAVCSRTSPGAPSMSRDRRSIAPPRSACRVHVLPQWYDVDDARRLNTLQAELCGGCSFRIGSAAQPGAAHRAAPGRAARRDRSRTGGSLPPPASRGPRNDPQDRPRLARCWRSPASCWRSRWSAPRGYASRRHARRLHHADPGAVYRTRGLARGRRAAAAGSAAARCRPSRDRAGDAACCCCRARRCRPISSATSGTGACRPPASIRISTCRRSGAGASARYRDLSGDQPRRLCADDLSADVADRVLPDHAHLRIDRLHEDRDGRLRGDRGLGDPAIAGGARTAGDRTCCSMPGIRCRCGNSRAAAISTPSPSRS